ncbi:MULTISPECIES: glycerophosphodiester phosphodiesterase [unclassified Psychrobacter]|uniref:glycerophosphodiester phosphodiesterase n=1 Tax=unclassified Psychrobacter TaxID=196806 RepID=UPI0018F41F67|nr:MULTISPECIES: glycerophosphodiester phosphodiesterase [unclassified Psychrobacter]
MIDLQRTRLLGHRGARLEALENTRFGFEYAHRLQPRGLAGIEFDVQLTADGQLVVFHDETLQRLCGIQSRVDQLTWLEVQRHLQSGHPIMTLGQLTELLCAPTLLAPRFDNRFSHIELEIKTHSRTNHRKLIDALAYHFGSTSLASLPITLTCFDTELLLQLQRHPLLSHVPRGLLIRQPRALATAPNTALQLGCVQLGIHYPLLTAEVIRLCHRYGLPISAWTVNDFAVMRQLIAWQVDVIITDIPAQVL